MRRPLLYGAVGMILEIVLYYYCGECYAWVGGLLYVGGMSVWQRFFCGSQEQELEQNYHMKRRMIGVMLLCCALGCTAIHINEAQYQNALSYIGKNCFISGRIVQSNLTDSVSKKVAGTDTEAYAEGRFSESDSEACQIQMRVAVDEISGKKIEPAFHVLIRSEAEQEQDEDLWLPGEFITAAGYLELPKQRRNPNCFDYRLYLRSIGVNAIFRQEHMEPCRSSVTEKLSLSGFLEKKKRSFIRDIKRKAGADAAAMVQGILFGEKQNLKDSILEDFQKNGTGHLLAVSGLHVGILYGFLCKMWRGKKGAFFLSFIIGISCCYMILAGFSPSVVRAAIMIDLHTLALVTHCRYDLRSAAFMVLMASLIKNPMQVFYAGFQMSFLAVFSLAAILPHVQRFGTGVLAGSTAIQLGITPCSMYLFHWFSPAAIFINIPMIALAGVLIPLGIVTMILQFMELPGVGLGFQILGGMCWMLRKFNEFSCIEGFTVFSVISPPRWMIALYYLGMLLLMSEDGQLMILRKQRKKIITGVLIITVAALCFGTVTRSGFESASITFPDVGQGDCIHIKSEDGNDILIDGGGSRQFSVGKKTLRPYFLKNGVRKIDVAFVTHRHTDHYQGIVELCQEGMIRRLFLYEGNQIYENEILDETGLKPDQIQYISQGQNIRIGTDANVQVLWPQRYQQSDYEEIMSDAADENATSLILRVETGNVSVLVTGDIDEKCEQSLVQIYGKGLKTDVLKIAHHGSKYSSGSEFLAMVNPRYAVFQVGKNNYGHPSEEVIQRCEKQGAEIYRNDRQGAIGMIKKGTVWHIETMQEHWKNP